MRILLLAALLALTALSGCFGGEDPEPTPTPTATSTPDPTPTAEPEPDNTPPTASLSASIEQGEIPVNVTFTLDGSDADGDALTWTLDLGDGNSTDGMELPATYEHSYTMEGLFTVTFTVSDGTDTAAQTLSINATAAAAGEGPIQSVEGSYVSGPDACAYLGVPALAGTTNVVFEVDPATWGQSFLAVYTASAPVVFLRVDYNNAAGDYIGVTPLPPDVDPEATEFSGTVPEGATVGSISSCGGGEVSVSYSAG